MNACNTLSRYYIHNTGIHECINNIPQELCNFAHWLLMRVAIASVVVVMSSLVAMAILFHFNIISTGHRCCQYQYPPRHDDHCWRVRPQRLGCPTCLPNSLVCLLNHTHHTTILLLHYHTQPYSPILLIHHHAHPCSPYYTSVLNQTPPTPPCPLVFFYGFGLWILGLFAMKLRCPHFTAVQRILVQCTVIFSRVA